MGSTGGVARTLLHSALVRDEVDAVYSLYKEKMVDEEAYGRYLTSPPSCERIPASLYRPILWGENLDGIQSEWQKIMLIGLPCQIKGAKKLLSKKFPKLDVCSVALICRQQKTAHYTDYVKKIVGISQVAYKNVTYRGEGWPGRLGVVGEVTEFPGFMESSEAFGKNLWRVPGCKFCSDCLGAASADITLADPWNHITEKDDPVGANIIMVWSDAGMRMIEKSQGMLFNDLISYDVVEKVISFNVINKKICAIQCRLGVEKNIIKRIQFWVREKKIKWFEQFLLSQKHGTLFVRMVCKIFK